MPSITHYVLDRFLETGSAADVQKAVPKPPPPPPDKATPVPVCPVRTKTSPASLYATPESTTLPDSPSSFPGTWSPYLINHKRRGASLAKTFSQGDVGSEGSQPKLPVMLPALPKGGEPTAVEEPEFTFQQSGNGQAEGDSGVEEATINGQNEMLLKGKGSVSAKNEQEQPEFEFQRGSSEALVRPVNVGRPLIGGAPKSDEIDTFLELQDSMSVASNTEADDAGMQERWWKSSSPFGTSVGTPGAEFYDAFEGTNQFVTLCLSVIFLFLCVTLPGFHGIRLLKQH